MLHSQESNSVDCASTQCSSSMSTFTNAVLDGTAGVVHSASLYSDFRDKTCEVSSSQYTVQWSAEDSITLERREDLLRLLFTTKTNGNGVCALHAACGALGASKRFFCTLRKSELKHLLEVVP